MSLPESSVFEIICECCGAKIQVDAKTRSIFSFEKKGHKKRTFEEVVDDVTSVAAKATEKFQASLERERNRDERLDKLFQEAKEKAAKDPNKRPPSIFDYD
ncbi:MAG: hypothetical protein AB7O52_14290 [Planctomycetota bacterium]